MKLLVESKEFVFEEDRPFESCHASTVVVSPNGDVLTAWFGGTEEGAKDVAIWISRKEGSNGWSEPIRVADAEGIPCWNPVLFTNPYTENEVILFYKIGHKITEWSTMVIKSNDDGKTWTNPVPLIEGDIGGRGPVKNKPIVTSEGVWLAPASIEGELWDAFVDISKDQGATWIQSNLVPLDRPSVTGKGVIQPSLWESEPGFVHMLLRSTTGYVFRSDSQDGGKTWSAGYPIELPNNNSGIDLVKVKDGSLILAHNPVRAESLSGARTPLVLSRSTDNGATWDEIHVLETAPGEYSYPAIITNGEDRLLLTYTWKREKISFWEFTMTF